jgi:hypothetical protein
MRNLLLAIVAILASVQVNAQKMSMEFLEGTWIPETPASYLEFSGLTKKDFNIKMTSTDEGNYELDIISYNFNKNNFYLESFYEPNNWKCIGRFIIIDKNTMAVDYISDAPAVVVYRRKTE